VTSQSVRDASASAAERAWRFLNDWADRVLVVSLARAHERRARVLERLGGLDFEFFTATDKRELDRERLVAAGLFDESATPRRFRHRREMNLGEIGCALSHRRIYEETVANGWSRVVVVEDDVVPRPEALAHLPAALAQLPAGWDLCYLGYWKNERPSAWAHVKRATYVALSPLRLVPWRTGEALRLLPSPFAPHLRRAGLHMCTHAYAVSAEGARKLLAAQTPVAFRADWLLTYLTLRGELSAFVVEPMAFDQEALAAYDGDPRSHIHA
jgi:glycosyl transferase, family 25